MLSRFALLHDIYMLFYMISFHSFLRLLFPCINTHTHTHIHGMFITHTHTASLSIWLLMGSSLSSTPWLLEAVLQRRLECACLSGFVFLFSLDIYP